MRGFALLVLLVSGACAQHRVGHDSLARESNRESPLHVVTVGSGPVTTVVLHGGPGARHNYLRPEWDQLQDIGRVVYYDQRGCGKSVREGPHSWKQHVQDLHNLLTALEPSGPIVLAGSSWGSNLALLYAYTYPDHVSALVLSGLVVWFSGEREWMKHLTPEEVRDLAALESGPATSTEVWDSATIAATSTSADPRLARRLGEMCSGNATALDYSLRSTPPLDSLRRITVPILLVSGPRPGALKNGAPTFAPFLPTAELVTIENAGHDPWFEQPDQFFAAVRRFLRTRVLK